MGGLLHPLEDGRARPDRQLVATLIADQLPELPDLSLLPVEPQGWDNTTYRLGADYTVRLPTAPRYAPQVHREARALPHLARHVSIGIPEIVFVGAPTAVYPHPWSVRRWVEGQTLAAPGKRLAVDLAHALLDLQAAPALEAMEPGPDSFHRGGSLGSWRGSFEAALSRLGSLAAPTRRVWDEAMKTESTSVTWTHGDIAPGNLLLREGRLAAIIDWGLVSVGDPACDLAIAWRSFDAEARAAFLDIVSPDEGMMMRGKAWAVWKLALIATGVAGEGGGTAHTARMRLEAIV